VGCNKKMTFNRDGGGVGCTPCVWVGRKLASQSIRTHESFLDQAMCAAHEDPCAAQSELALHVADDPCGSRGSVPGSIGV
jgi:hypothetical protein